MARYWERLMDMLESNYFEKPIHCHILKEMN